jgi:MFS family permease
MPFENTQTHMLKSTLAGSDPATSLAADAESSVRRTMASLSLSMLLSSMGTSIANAGLPTLAQAFGASFQQAQWIVLAYLLAITTLIVSAGRLGDMWGRRSLLLTGIGLFSLASLLCGLSPTLGLVIAARALQGLGAALMMALSLAMAGEAVPKARTASAMGLLGSMSAIGTALGPSLGGLLIAGLGWRALFLVLVPLGLGAWLLAQRHLPIDRPTQQASSQAVDAQGTLLLVLTLAAYALAMTLGHGNFGSLNVGLLLGALLGLGLFIRVEARAALPLIRIEMFNDRRLSASLAMSALVATVIMATFVVGPFYLARALGLGTTGVGLALAVGPVVAALGGVPAGRIADRFGAPRMTLLGLVAMAAGSLALVLLPRTLGVPAYIGPIALLTAGYALFQTANNTSVMADVPADRRGLVSGLISLSRNLGLITGASLMGAVFARASATSDVGSLGAEAAALGMRATFGVATAMLAVAIALALKSSRRAV